MDLGAEPPLDAVLVDKLQAAGAAAGLQQRVGRRVLAHLADPAQVALLLVRLLQQQPVGGDTAALRTSQSTHEPKTESFFKPTKNIFFYFLFLSIFYIADIYQRR